MEIAKYVSYFVIFYNGCQSKDDKLDSMFLDIWDHVYICW